MQAHHVDIQYCTYVVIMFRGKESIVHIKFKAL